MSAVNKLIKRIEKMRSIYQAERDPHDGRINALETSINMGEFHEIEVQEALASGHLFKGGEMQSFYVRLV